MNRVRSRRVVWALAGVWATGAWLEPAQARQTIAIQATSAEVIRADADVYRQHAAILSSPFFEGRAPGTEGHKRAADYIEFEFKRLGLRPPFDVKDGAPDAGGGKSYRQPFEAPPSARPGDSIRVEKQEFSYAPEGAGAVALQPGTDFNVLGFSGNAEVTAPLAFAGYSLETDEYESYPKGADSLFGRIAVVLRFEPMDEQGHSLWAKRAWSPAAALAPKLTRAADHGALAIILVNPPGTDDERAKTLEDISLGGRALQIPVIMASQDAADAMLRAADEQHRGLMDFRKLADNPPDGHAGVMNLSMLPVTISTKLERIPLWTQNVGGLLPGRGDLAGEYIVIGGHYDHVGYGYFSSRDPNPKGKLHPGADDNASGTSGVLTAAKKLAEAYAALPPDQPARSILFLTFSGEESGLVGSRYYVRNPIMPLDRHTLMFNMDMIGRLREGKIELQGTDTGEGMREWVEPYNHASGLQVAYKRGGSGPSDHATFFSRKIPVLFFFTGMHKEYHAPGDVFSLLNIEGAAQVTDFVERLALDAATRPARFPFAEGGGREQEQNDQPQASASAGGVGVRFGIAPGDYSGTEPGVLVGEVFPKTPAAEAGLKEGDLIIMWNEHKVTDVETWMPILREHKPGDKVTIHYQRKVEGEIKEFTTECTLIARSRGGQ